MENNIVLKWLDENKYIECQRKIADAYEKELYIYVERINGKKKPEEKCLLSIQVIYSPQIPLPENNEICLLLAEINIPCSQLKIIWPRLQHMLNNELGLNPSKHHLKLLLQ